MSNKVKQITIKLELESGIELELSIADAKDLHNQLGGLLSKPAPSPIDLFRIFPEPSRPYTRPYWTSDTGSSYTIGSNWACRSAQSNTNSIVE